MRKSSVAVLVLTLLLTLTLYMAVSTQQQTPTLELAVQTQPAAQKTPVTWAKTYGNVGEDIATSVAATPDGGCIIVGKTSSFGAGGYDFWVVKLDSNGSIQWQKSYGGEGDDEAYGVAVTDDGYVVVGSTNSFNAGSSYDFWVLKLNSTGGIVWQKTCGGSGTDIAYGVVFDQAGDDRHIVVVGDTSSFGAGDYDFWALRLNSSTGEQIWQYTYGGLEPDNVRGVAFAGNGYIVAGYTQSFGVSNRDVWVLRLNMDGTLQWQNLYNCGGNDSAFSVTVANDKYVVAGYTESIGSSKDFLVLVLNSTGEVHWAKKYGKTGLEWAYGVAFTGDGYIVAGQTSSLGASGDDFLVMKIDQSGTAQWQKTYGGLGNDYACGVTIHSDGYITVAGVTQSFNVNGSDFWVLRLNGSGNIANPIQEFKIFDVSTDAELIFPSSFSSSVTNQASSSDLPSTNVDPSDTYADVKVQAPPTPEGGIPSGGAPTEGGVEGWAVAALLFVSGTGASSWVWLIGAGVALAVMVAGVLLFWRHKRVKT